MLLRDLSSISSLKTFAKTFAHALFFTDDICFGGGGGGEILARWATGCRASSAEGTQSGDADGMNGCDPGDKNDTGDDDRKVAKSEGSNGGDFADKALCFGDDREADKDVDGVKTGGIGLKTLGGDNDVDDVVEPWGSAGASDGGFSADTGK